MGRGRLIYERVFGLGVGLRLLGGRVYEERGEVIYERRFFGLGVGFGCGV